VILRRTSNGRNVPGTWAVYEVRGRNASAPKSGSSQPMSDAPCAKLSGTSEGRRPIWNMTAPQSTKGGSNEEPVDQLGWMRTLSGSEAKDQRSRNSWTT
jgi:hypothetical protein